MIDYAAKVKEREALRPRSGKNRPKTGMNGMPLDRHLPTLPAIVKQAENIQQQPMVQHIRQEVNFQASNDVPIPVTNNDQHVSPKKTMGPMKAMIHHRTTEAHAR